MKKILPVVAAVASLSFAVIASAEDIPTHPHPDPHKVQHHDKEKEVKNPSKHKKLHNLRQKLKEIHLGHETAPGGGSLAPDPVPDAPPRPSGR